MRATARHWRVEVATSIPSARVIRVLEQLIEMHGKPKALGEDNGSEFTSIQFSVQHILDCSVLKRQIGVHPLQLAFSDSRSFMRLSSETATPPYLALPLKYVGRLIRACGSDR
jgi:hypothetical protein